MAIALCLALPKVKAQTVNGVRLSELKADYIEISAIRPPFSKKILIRLEYGQKVTDEDSVMIKDVNGIDLEFNSLMDCINKMKSYGYELFQAYAIPLADWGANKTYVLKKATAK